MTISTLPVGTQTITETYSGDGNFTTSNGQVSQTVVVSIYALNASTVSPTITGAVYLSGSSSINIPGQLVVDSPAKPAVTLTGSSSIIASNGVKVAGTVSVAGSSSIGPKLTTGITAVADPLAGLAVPSLTGSAVSINLTNGAETINPGIYSQINVSGAASLKLNPGVYVIRGGGFSESGSASISGSGVMVYIAGSAYPAIGGTYGGISLSGAGTVNLSAPTTGAYAGIQFFQARANPTGISISGSAAMSLGGVIYASDALLAASGSGSVITDGMVVNRIQLSGSAVAAHRSATARKASRWRSPRRRACRLLGDPPFRLSPKPTRRQTRCSTSWLLLCCPRRKKTYSAPTFLGAASPARWRSRGPVKPKCVQRSQSRRRFRPGRWLDWNGPGRRART